VSADLSKVTSDAISQALQEEGSIITGMLGVVTTIDEDGDQILMFVALPGQTSTQTAGLAKALDIHAERIMWGTLAQLDQED
jgi:hypothetical protein